MPGTGFKVLAMCAALAGGVLALPQGPAAAQSLYDANVVKRLDGLTPQQRAQVQKVVAESRRKARAVFKKHGIDPNARPVFNKLQRASQELQAVQQQERRQMVKILNKDQYAQYSKIIAETQARVRAAAQ